MNQVHLFVKELISNEQFRRLALENPGVALGRFKLSPCERAALTSLCLHISSQGSLTTEASATSLWA